MNNYHYPESPKADTSGLLKLDASYRKHVINTLLSMLVFILGYLAIFALSLALIYWGAKLAVGILSVKAHWLTLAAAAGIMVMVVMFFVFIVKFLFKVKKEETKGKLVITREQHPVLFDFIERVCKETKAPFPKKIVLSNDVNACVYYNSSFLSMFFPIRKNLEIGLGLVNCVNITEFKAIVAHEFGHFSQSSTRLGSYVYRFNRIVHDLLYDNDGWSTTLEKISSVHAIIGFFGHITIAMVKVAIQFFILLYKLINVSYMSLSREMEFNADNVAVSVTGNKPIISALYRLEFGQEAFNYTVQGMEDYNPEEASRPKNFFTLMQRNLKILSKLNQLNMENGLPIIDTSIAKKNFLDNRISYKDIWATHPPTEEREKNASRIVIASTEVKDSPWLLFNDPVKLQEKMSAMLVDETKTNIKVVDNEILEKHFEVKENETAIDPIYKDYYNIVGETYASPETYNSAELNAAKTLSFNELFNDEIIHQIKRYNKNMHDTEVIKNISEGHLDVKRFEFDGKNYTRYYSADIYKQLKQETEEQNNKLKQHKQKVSNWFYANALEIDAAIANSYKEAMDFRVKMVNDRDPLITLINSLLELYHTELSKNFTDEDIPELRNKLKMLYNEFKTYQANITNNNVPAFLIDKHILTKSYADTIFSKQIDDPTSSRNLEGFGKYYDDLNDILSNLAKLDNKVFYHLLSIQSEILKRLKLIT